MQPKRRKRKSKLPLIVLAVALAAVVGVGLFAVIQSLGGKPGTASATSGAGASSAVSASLPGGASASGGNPEPPVSTAALPEEYRAMWISFLEWQTVDISTEAAMRQAAAAMFDNCKAMGLNTVIVAARPFGDALYKSEVFPWSHLITGTQGQDPGYDPLAVLVEEAHARSLRIEAWINPYRINNTAAKLEALSADNPATLHPEWVREANGLWYDPGIPEVQQMIAEGVAEIVRNYDVDGIHFDDYFYPEFTAEQKQEGLDAAFDEATYIQYGTGKELATWRRGNVNTLVKNTYAAIKAANPAASFGISPQGNNENNYNMQYSDVKLWMATPGYVDYVMPQLYWGFGYRTSSGRENYAFANIAAEWASYPRDASVRLFAGLAAYRVEAGTDGGANDQAEWATGHNLADMAAHLRTVPGYTGFALFRYNSLYASESPLAAEEANALAALLNTQGESEPPQSASASTTG